MFYQKSQHTMDRPRTTPLAFQPTGYRLKPQQSTVKIIRAFTDLAVDSQLAYHHFCPDTPDTTIDMLYYKTKWASRAGIAHWYYNLQNLKLAYRLGYIELINWGGADWINDCCDYFRDDQYVACWFRRMASVYVNLSEFKLPKLGEIWRNKGTQLVVASVQPNTTDPKYYDKEMIVLYDNKSSTLLNFVQDYWQSNISDRTHKKAGPL